MISILTGLVIILGVIPTLVIGTMLTLGFSVTWTIGSHLMLGICCHVFLTCVAASVRHCLKHFVAGVAISTKDLEKESGE